MVTWISIANLALVVAVIYYATKQGATGGKTPEERVKTPKKLLKYAETLRKPTSDLLWDIYDLKGKFDEQHEIVKKAKQQIRENEEAMKELEKYNLQQRGPYFLLEMKTEELVKKTKELLEKVESQQQMHQTRSAGIQNPHFAKEVLPKATETLHQLSEQQNENELSEQQNENELLEYADKVASLAVRLGLDYHIEENFMDKANKLIIQLQKAMDQLEKYNLQRKGAYYGVENGIAELTRLLSVAEERQKRKVEEAKRWEEDKKTMEKYFQRIGHQPRQVGFQPKQGPHFPKTTTSLETSSSVKVKCDMAGAMGKIGREMLATKYMRDKQDECISPLTAMLGIFMILPAAAPINQETILNSMSLLDCSMVEVLTKFKEMMSCIKTKKNGVEINLAILAIIKRNLPELDKEYEMTVTNYLGANIERDDFDDLHKSKNEINLKIGYLTKGRIPNFFDTESQSALVGAQVLDICAMDFVGEWQYRFNKISEKGKFYPNKRTTIEIEFMENHEEHEYALIEELRCAALRLFFMDRRFSMLFLLPLPGTDVEDMLNDLRRLSNEEWNMVSNKLQKQPVHAKLPIFVLTTKAMGMLNEATKIFGENFRSAMANMPNMFEDHVVHVGKILQKNLLEVGPEGVKVATVTVVTATRGKGVNEFIADRPFVCELELRNEVTGQHYSILTGVVQTPKRDG